MTDNFDFKPETLRKEEDERKGGGALAGLLSRLGLGGASGGAGAEAGVGGGLLASKAAVVALLLAGTTVAAGIGMLGSGSRGTVRHAGGGSVFSSGDKEGAIGAAAELAQDPAPKASADGASTSLDYLAKANAPAEAAKDAAASGAESVDASASAADANAGSQNVAAASAHASVPRPQMVKSAGMPSTSGGGNTPRLEAQAGLGGAGFQNVYKAPPKGTSAMTAGSRARMGATRLSAIRPGGTAAKQLAQTSKVVKGNLRSGNVSSAGSGLTYDGGAGSVGTAGTPASGAGVGGTGTGGTGVDSSPGSQVSKDLREVQPPPEPVKNAENKSPYQNLVYVAIGALLAGMALLFWAGKVGDAAKVAVGPEKLALLAKAKMISWGAAACGAVAAAMGLMLWQQYDQMMQGVMFTISGGILAAKAAMAALDSTAEKQAQADMAKTNADYVKGMNESGLNRPEGATGNLDVVKDSTNYGDGTFRVQDATGKQWTMTGQYGGTSPAGGLQGQAIDGAKFTAKPYTPPEKLAGAGDLGADKVGF